MRLGETLGKAIDMCRSFAHGRDIFDTKIKWAVVGLALLTVVVLGMLMVHRAAFSTELNSDFSGTVGGATICRGSVQRAPGGFDHRETVE
jgi:hypothetical protein